VRGVTDTWECRPWPDDRPVVAYIGDVPDSSSRRGSSRVPLVALAVLTVLVAEGLVHPERRARAGVVPADVVPAVTRAWDGASLPGALAVVVARQHRPATGLSVRAADAQSARVSAAVAGNGRLARRPFASASMVKLLMAEDLLHRDRAGTVRLRPEDLDLMSRMISSSDDPAASELWVRYDGERMVRDVVRRYGLSGTAPPLVAGQWGRTVVTAEDLARLLSLLPVVAHPDDADVLLGWMRSATPEAADGFDQRFGLYGAADGEAAVKQGWMCCVGGQRHLHSVGVLGRTVVVLLSEVDQDVDYEAVQRALTAAAAEVPPPRHT
jgi:hypothetical protein